MATEKCPEQIPPSLACENLSNDRCLVLPLQAIIMLVHYRNLGSLNLFYR